MVVATLKPEYDAVYRRFFAATGLHPPDDNYYPPAPKSSVFKPGESTTKGNVRSTDI